MVENFYHETQKSVLGRSISHYLHLHHTIFFNRRKFASDLSKTLMKKKFNDCEHIHSVNPLYLIIHSVTGYFKEKNGEKYLILDLIEKYEEVFSGIKSEIETINSGE